MSFMDQTPNALGTQAVLGCIDHCSDGRVSGWAARSDHGPGRLTVELIVDGVAVTATVADVHRPDVREAGVGDGCFGFTLAVPDTFFDGHPHVLGVRDAATGVFLPGGMREFNETARTTPAPAEPPVDPVAAGQDAFSAHPHAPVSAGAPGGAAQAGTSMAGEATPAGEADSVDTLTVGRLDHWTPAAFIGWMARSDGGSSVLNVDLVVDGTPLVRAVADLHRADLASANIGSGRHAFHIPPPDGLFDDQSHVIEIREAISGETLTGSPVTIRFNACDLWDNSAQRDHVTRCKLADEALAFCEAADDSRLDESIHQVLLRMASWMQGQAQGRRARRLGTQLRRLLGLRCRVETRGFIGPRVIGGVFSDDWASADERVLLELLEDGQVIASTHCHPGPGLPAGQGFSFALPDVLFDDEVHRLDVSVKALGGTICTWSFLLASSNDTKDARLAPLSDSVWRSVPAALVERGNPHEFVPLSKVDAALFALEDALDAGSPENRGDTLRLTLELANALREAGERVLARDRFEEALRLDDQCSEALAGRLDCLIALGEPSAQAQLDAALEAFPDEALLFRLQDDLRARQRVRSVRTIAFYLPQFHPTPENDAWWGKGFTEWSNVGGAVPLFDGHLQPRRPTALGYYDLRLAESANAQFDLARQYGVDGFCYYYYWFNGRRILQQPLMDLTSGRTGPFPFCICWANEPWTRSWDGSSGEVLLAQNHTAESDLEFIKDIAPLLRHKDYIRVNGKPIVMVYRAQLLAEPQETVTLWREWCRANGIGELHLCVVQSFGFNDPRPFGFDAAVEFPPHCPSTVYPDWEYHRELTDVKGRVAGFEAKIFDYQTFASGAIKRPRESFQLHRAAMVAWDNTARRGKSAHVFHRFSLEIFERWVRTNARKAAVEQEDAVSFINAWNEWAEGSVMEPDTHFGYEILESTRRAKQLANFDPDGTYWLHEEPVFPEERLARRERIILVGHDAFFAGAQTNLLNIARSLKRQLDMDVVLMLIEGGDLLPDYERVAPTFVIGKADGWQERLQAELRRYRVLGARKAICNTVVTGDVLAELKKESFRVLSLVHEMPALIESYQLSSHCWTIADKADHLVFASQVVADEFCNRYWPDPAKRVIAPQGIAFNGHHDRRAAARREVRQELRLQPDCAIVLGCGHGDTRKGIDLFVQLAAEVSRQFEAGAVAFVWVGTLEWQLEPYIQADVVRLGLSDVFRVTGRTTDPGRYFIAGDLFALTSREDPFPSVVMEAFDAKLPVLAFEGGGGYVDIVSSSSGALVPYLDVPAMAESAAGYLRDGQRRTEVGELNHLTCRERFGYVPYLRKLLALLGDVPAEQVMGGVLERRAWFGERPRPTITAIVPNFNYARYLQLRLRTVVAQTLPPDEIIVLDDASTDTSLELIRAFAAQSSIPIKVVTCESNTGNPFVQWAKGLALAKGDLIWIAEADDYCEPILLETLAREFVLDDVKMAWTDSVMVDAQGRSGGAQYKAYYEGHYGVKWRMPFRMSGRQLIEECLLVENVIPNASAVLFRRDAVSSVDVAAIQQYKFSGDWWFWLSLAQVGTVSYIGRPLNYHRRHSRSVMGEVLRSGSSLMKETMGFYERVVARKPECISASAGLRVLDRLQRIYAAMPELVGESARITAHPALSSQYAALARRLQGAAAQHRSPRAKTTLLVLSHDVFGDDMLGGALLRSLQISEQALKVVLLGPADDIDAFIDRSGPATPDFGIVRTHGPAPASAPGDVSGPARLPADIARDLHEAFGDLATVNVVTHGLLAHCHVAGLVTAKKGEWTMVASKEFDAVLGLLPKTPGVTLDLLRRAICSCGQARFVGAWPPHALARLAKANALPVEAMWLGSSGRRAATPAGDATLCVLGIAQQATPQQWKSLATLLRNVSAHPGAAVRLRLLTWGPRPGDLGLLEQDPDIELVEIFDRPVSLAAHGDVMIVAASGAEDDEIRVPLEFQQMPIPGVLLDDLIRGDGAATASLGILRDLLDAVARKTVVEAQRGAAGVTI